MLTTCKRSKTNQFLIFAEAAIQQVQKDANTTHNSANAHVGFSSSNINSAVVANNPAYGPDQNASVMKGQLALAANTDDYVVRPVNRPDFVNFFKMLSGPDRRLRLDLVLLTEPTMTISYNGQ